MTKFVHRLDRTLAKTPVGTIAAMAFIVLVSLLFKPVAPAGPENGQSPSLQGRVVELLAEEEVPAGPAGETQTIQRVLVEISQGERKGHAIEVEYGRSLIGSELRRVRLGDRVLVAASAAPTGESWYITDFVRLPALFVLTLLFAAATVLVGRQVGVRSLISMGFGVLVIALFILPRLAAAQDPVTVVIVGSVLAMAPSLYLTYGWRWKTHTALLGLIASLGLTALLAVFFVDLSRLTGFASEEAALFAFSSQVQLDMRGLALGGIILGTVGVLDDVTVGQASAIFELKHASPTLNWRQLFQHGMVIGRDHIASMVNTLMMAYVGAALPFFLLLTISNNSLSQTLNRELLAEEIIRTLVGSLGLISAVPITSLIGSLVAARRATPPA